jgi:hypothetical protein
MQPTDMPRKEVNRKKISESKKQIFSSTLLSGEEGGS